ncbi:protein of unknown function [Nitrosospira sp. Nl5]|uniref:DUF748 domain-containing protein n=1 Tax=Nitrosospira sp. Nl5 TaxID=200120 RepID=UPI000889BDCA|nr:DUF748 domain-containing protein [Nitrosospira sp. Nl5]SCY27613.1 protein of unknown function [Nitrosospira sp. Nl5]
MKKIFARAAASKIVWAAAALFVIYTLGGFLLAPYLLERNLPRYAEQHLGQRASVGEIRINPYLFILDVSDFQLDGTGENAMLKFKRLVIDFELSSIFRGAWTFAEFRTEKLDLRLEIDREGRLNVMELVKRLQGPEEPERPDQPPPSIVFEHVMVSDSSISFNDLSDATPASTAFAPINLELTGFSTIPDREGRYILAASLPAGASLAWKGSLTLHPLASSGEFSIKGMKLATAWQFLRDELRMAEPRGEFALAGRYDFSYQQGKATLGLDEIQAEISDLLIAPPGGSPALLALRSFRVSDARFALDKRELVVPRLTVSDGKLSASVASDGALDWQSLVVTANPAPRANEGAANGDAVVPDSTAAVEDAKRPWRVRVENAVIERLALAYSHHASSPAIVFRAGAVNSKFRLDMAAGADPAQGAVEGIQLAVNNIAVAPTVAGTADAADTAPLATLDSFSLTGGRLDMGARTALVEEVTISHGDVAITRGPGGPVDLLQLALGAGSKSKEVSRPPDTVSAVPADAPWKYRVGSVELKQLGVHLADRGFTPPISYDIKVVSVAAENIDSASESPIVFATELRIGEQGVVNGGGTLQQDFGQARGKFDATGIPLEPLRPLVARHATLDLKSGNVAVSAELGYRSDATPSMTVQGNASIHNLRLNEAGTEERLIAWKSLSAKKIALSLSPNRLAIKEVRLVEPGMKLLIGEDRSVNLNQVLKNSPSEEAAANQLSPAEKPPEKPAGKSARSQDGSPFPAEIGQVQIVNGALDFADLSLVLPFSTHVHALDGAIVGISSARQTRAEIALTGQVEAYGEASAAGALIPRDPKKFLDIEANFENIEMPPLSAYSATFAGRKIASGKLWLTLNYKIVDGKLAGENTIMLADFKLGERIEAPNALDLPLDLAIALLKGPDGRIKLAVPVEGDVGNPTFDYGTVIRGALANVIRRVVTSPFRMLAGLLGESDAEKLRKVEFEPGSDEIAPAQREQLDILVEALKKRPKIGVVVRGSYDAKRDGQHLRSERVRHELAIATGVRKEGGEAEEDLGLIAYGDADVQKALEKLLAERAGGNAIKKFADDYAKRSGRQPDRVNALLGLFGRGSEDRAFYEALFEHLVELQPLPDDALQSLGKSRAQAIIDVLLKAGIDSKRVISGELTQVSGEPGTPVAVELSLDVAAGES